MVNRRRRKREEGFTLIELIVVVAILGFLLAIAIPRYMTAREQGAIAATKANLHNLANAMELAATELVSTEYPGTGDDTDGDGTLDVIEVWLLKYLPQTPKSPKKDSNGDDVYYRYATNETETAPATSFAIWDPNTYKVGTTIYCYAVGPGGMIGEGTGTDADEAAADAVSKATNGEVTITNATTSGVELKWPSA